MLKRLRIQGFKSIEDLTVDLAPLVILFGPNAAGKSNLLDAQMLLSRLVTERTLADAFSSPLRGYPAEGFTLPEGGLPGLLEQGEASLALEAVVESRGPSPSPQSKPTTLEYRVSVRIVPSTGKLTVIDEYLARLKWGGAPVHKPRIECEEGRLTVRRDRERGQPRREELRLNHTQASNLQFTGERYPDFDRLRQELQSWRTYYLDPRIAMREAQPPTEVTDIGSEGQWLAPFLYRLKHDENLKGRFHAIRRALHNAIPSIDGLEVDLDRKRGTLEIQVIQDGVPFSSRVISEGTLRVLALCAIAANPWPGSLIAFEEPENGVHPRRRDVVCDLLLSMAVADRTQVIVTTHSPGLVAVMARKQRDNPDRIRLLACHRAGRTTEIRPFETGGTLFDDPEIKAALKADSEDGLVEAMLRRGWLDG